MATTKLMEALVNAAAIIMQKDSQLTEYDLAQILHHTKYHTHFID